MKRFPERLKREAKYLYIQLVLLSIHKRIVMAIRIFAAVCLLANVFLATATAKSCDFLSYGMQSPFAIGIDGSGPFYAGSAQSVSYYRPIGSLVSAVSNISLVAVADGQKVTFGTAGSDLVTFGDEGPVLQTRSGIFHLTLPQTVGNGSYLYQIALKTSDEKQLSSDEESCTVKTLPFHIASPDACRATCGADQNAPSYVICVENDGGKLPVPGMCPPGTVCRLDEGDVECALSLNLSPPGQNGLPVLRSPDIKV